MLPVVWTPYECPLYLQAHRTDIMGVEVTVFMYTNGRWGYEFTGCDNEYEWYFSAGDAMAEAIDALRRYASDQIAFWSDVEDSLDTTEIV